LQQNVQEYEDIARSIISSINTIDGWTKDTRTPQEILQAILKRYDEATNERKEKGDLTDEQKEEIDAKAKAVREAFIKAYKLDQEPPEEAVQEVAETVETNTNTDPDLGRKIEFAKIEYLVALALFESGHLGTDAKEPTFEQPPPPSSLEEAVGKLKEDNKQKSKNVPNAATAAAAGAASAAGAGAVGLATAKMATQATAAGQALSSWWATTGISFLSTLNPFIPVVIIGGALAVGAYYLRRPKVRKNLARSLSYGVDKFVEALVKGKENITESESGDETPLTDSERSTSTPPVAVPAVPPVPALPTPQPEPSADNILKKLKEDENLIGFISDDNKLILQHLDVNDVERYVSKLFSEYEIESEGDEETFTQPLKGDIEDPSSDMYKALDKFQKAIKQADVKGRVDEERTRETDKTYMLNFLKSIKGMNDIDFVSIMKKELGTKEIDGVIWYLGNKERARKFVNKFFPESAPGIVRKIGSWMGLMNDFGDELRSKNSDPKSLEEVLVPIVDKLIVEIYQELKENT